jgi:hypothetical protein
VKRERPPRPSRTKQVIEEELACALVHLLGIPREHAKNMTAEQVRSLVQFDHVVHHAIGGEHVHHNLTPRQILDHREKTHTIDRPQIRKTDRIGDKEAAFQARVLAKSGQDAPAPVKTKPKVKIKSRGFQKPPEGHKHKWGHR